MLRRGSIFAALIDVAFWFLAAVTASPRSMRLACAAAVTAGMAAFCCWISGTMAEQYDRRHQDLEARYRQLGAEFDERRRQLEAECQRREEVLIKAAGRSVMPTQPLRPVP